MKKQMCCLPCALLCVGAAFAEIGYQIELTNVLHHFSSSRRWERMNATNIIDSLVATATNTQNIAECRLLKAAVLIECAEVELDNDAYSEATNLCAMVKSEYLDCPNDWRLWGAILIEMQAFASMEQYSNAFVAATNALSLSPPVDFERATNTWCALFGVDIPSRISLTDAFRINAADALISIDRRADISAYTNGLSQAGILAITEMLAK